MNDERIARAEFLGEQLGNVMRALGTALTGRDAVLFLDRLARLEGYAATELDAVSGLPDLVAMARAARDAHAAELGRAAGLGLDLERFLDAGRSLPVNDEAGERDGWLRDLLLVATVTPWLTPARQMLARAAIERALAMVEADADAFLAASLLVEDRRRLEGPASLGPDAGRVLELLDELPLLASFDRNLDAASPARVDAALAVAGRHAVEAADDALLDHANRSAARLPSSAERGALAAASDETSICLVRVAAGEWILTRHRGTLRLRFEGEAEGDIAVEVLEGAAVGPIPVDEHGEFPLPDSTGSLSVRLRIGPDSRVVAFDSPEA